MPEIDFSCPHCGQSLEVEEGGSGLTMPCPACGRDLTVPPASGAQPRPSDAPPAAEAGRSSGPVPSTPPPVPGTGPSRPPPIPRPESRPGKPPPLPERRAPGTKPLPARELSGLDQVFSSFGQALALPKIGFAVLAGFASLLVVGILALAAKGVGAASPGLRSGLGFLTAVVAVGLGGVTAGGLAHLACEEQQGRAAVLLAACRFAGRRFAPLFGSAVLLALGVLGAGWIVNRIIGVLTESEGAGSSLAALLFVPQTLFNGALVLCLMAGVLAPCAVAVSGHGAGTAVREVATLVRRQSGAVVGQLGLTLACAVLMQAVIGTVLFSAIGTSLFTNAPQLPSLFPASDVEDAGLGSFPGFSDEDVLRGSPFGAVLSPGPGQAAPEPAGHQQGGDLVRWASVVLLLVAGAAVPGVFWVCSFTRFYAMVTSTPAPPKS